ncbi:MAG: anhydro-N-acetylmuramic acid kinase [Nodosilinea sp.]
MRVIGLISGTSVDGIDAALVEIEGQGDDLSVTFIDGLTHPYPAELKPQILRACAGEPVSLEALASLDDAIAQQFSLAAQSLIHQAGAAELIASHGQTVFHRPAAVSHGASGGLGYSLQLGRGAVIARQAGLPTVSDFRRADIELGGEGAPLVPIVDRCLFSHPQEHRCVQNIGGIGNVAYLPPWTGQGNPPPVLGWDTGPGNSLIDIAVHTLSEGTLAYDQDGRWAAAGTPCQALIDRWLEHPYLAQRPPKSTGRELFGWAYFDQCHRAAQRLGLSPTDLVATLTELTAATIAQSYRAFLPRLPDRVLVCGGGGQNPVLMARIQRQLSDIPVVPTDSVGVSAIYKEAIAFAVLGFWHWHRFPGNLPAVTGAAAATVLGHCSVP